MKKTLKFVCMLLSVWVVLLPTIGAKAEGTPPIFGQSGVAIDAKTGEILYDKLAKEQASPASMTKVLTALLIAEHMEDGEKMTVSANAVATECSCYGVEEGETLTKEDAIHALMIQSANDVSVVVAEHIGGSVEKFAEMMNDKAKELGASKDTNFVTPNGLDAEAHHVSAYDMALIVKEAIRNEEVLEAMLAKEYTVNSDRKSVTLVRHDSIHNQEHAVGGKTGYTSKSGNTLTMYFQEGDKEIITVVMKSDRSNHYNDSVIMSTHAFEQLEAKQVYKKNEVVDTLELSGKKIPLKVKEEFIVTEKKGSKQTYTIETKLNVSDELVRAGEPVGTGNIYRDSVLVGAVDLVADEDVLFAKESVTKELKDMQKLSIWWALIVPWGFYVGYLLYYNLKKRKQTKAKNE